MASCLCRNRRRILLFCSPCILLLVVMIYVMIALCYVMKHGAPAGHITYVAHPVLSPRFIASGLKRSRELAAHPEKTFWRSELDTGALWNILQYLKDHHYNPILNPHLTAKPYVSYTTERASSPNYTIKKTVLDHSSLPVQMRNFVTTMFRRDYSLIMDPLDVCDFGASTHRRGPMLLLAIKTQTGNFENREAIRETWGQSGRMKSQSGRRKVIRTVFLLGKSEVLRNEEELQMESDKYGDIIQWDFNDTFFNLTLKDVLFWDWFSKRCPLARFIFKGDDDIFVRTPGLLDHLLAVEANVSCSNGSITMDTFVMGDVIDNAAPIRLNDTKYYIPKSFYKGLYPSYPGGGGVVYSGSLAHRLLKVSRRVHLFPIDDVYLGMCLQRLAIYPIHQPAFLTFDFPKNEPKDPCANHTILLLHKRSPADMRQLWSETLRPSPECRNLPLRVKPRPD